jgi:hypothetical protein
VRAAACATQVIISDNLFVNFGSSAVEVISSTGPSDLPAGIAWEWTGENSAQKLHREPLTFEHVQLATRSYK